MANTPGNSVNNSNSSTQQIPPQNFQNQNQPIINPMQPPISPYPYPQQPIMNPVNNPYGMVPPQQVPLMGTGTLNGNMNPYNYGGNMNMYPNNQFQPPPRVMAPPVKNG